MKKITTLLLAAVLLTATRAQTWINYTKADDALITNVNEIVIDAQGNKWFAANKGLVKFDGTTWTDYTAANDTILKYGARAIAIDAQGNKWLGTWGGGVCKFDGTSWTNYNKSSGLVNNYVMAVTIDKKGNVWFGTINGVSKYDGTTWTNYTTADNPKLKSLLQNHMTTDAEGNIWFGILQGVTKFDGSKWTNYLIPSNDSINNYCMGLTMDAQGNKWFSSIHGFVTKYDGTNWTSYTPTNSGLMSAVYTITIDPQGNKWFGCTAGVSKFDGTNWTNYTDAHDGLLFQSVVSIAVDKQGNKWLSRWGEGVSVLKDGASGDPGNNTCLLVKKWTKSFNDKNEVQLIDAIQTPDGGFLIGGNSHGGYWVLKTDINGEKIWDSIYAGNNVNYFNCMISAKDGFVLGGYSNSDVGNDKSEPCNGHYDIWIIKIDPYGRKIWDKTFGGSDMEALYKIIQTNDEGFLLIGQTASAMDGSIFGELSGYLVKVDKDGAKEWEKRIGTINYDKFVNGIQTSDSGYLILGDTRFNGHHHTMHKISSTGNVIWQKSLDSIYLYGVYDINSATEVNDGYLIGASIRVNSTSVDYCLTKYDKDGNEIWNKTNGDATNNHLLSMLPDGNNSLLYMGTNYEDTVLYVMKTDLAGKMTCSAKSSILPSSIVISVNPSRDNGYIVGTWITDGSGDRNHSIIKFNIEGESEDPVIYSDPTNIESREGDDVNFSITVKNDLGCKYQWYHSEDVIADANDKNLDIDKLTANDKGEYFCTIETNRALYRTKSAVLTINEPEVTDTTACPCQQAGLDNDISCISIFPNPVNNMLTVNADEIRKAEILDIDGRVLKSTANRGRQVSIDVSDLSAGVYVVRISTGSKSISRKIVKL